MLQQAIDKVNELINMDMGSLVEDKKDRLREKVRIIRGYPGACFLTLLQRKWPEEKIPVGLETIRNFNVRAKVVGPSVCSFRITLFGLSLSVCTGYVREVHPARDGNTSTNQRARLRFCGPRDRSGTRRAYVHSCHVSLVYLHLTSADVSQRSR
jgi:hypothetical protein